jgi:hypothetical protein
MVTAQERGRDLKVKETRERERTSLALFITTHFHENNLGPHENYLTPSKGSIFTLKTKFTMHEPQGAHSNNI